MFFEERMKDNIKILRRFNEVFGERDFVKMHFDNILSGMGIGEAD